MTSAISSNLPAGLQTYIGTDPASQIQRAKEFAAQNPTAVVTVASTSLMSAGIGAWTGIVVGTIAAAAVGAPPVGPIINVPMALGGALGLHLGTKHQIIQIQESDEFLKWQAEAIKTCAYGRFKKEICDDPSLSEHHCPLTKQLMTFPVKDSNGCLFENREIKAYLQKHGGQEAPHPIKPNVKIKADELKFDPEYHKIVQAKLAELKKKKATPITQEVQQGLAAYMSSIHENRTSVVLELIKKDVQACIEGKVSKENTAKAMAHILDQFKLE